jgi:hypothetical protein
MLQMSHSPTATTHNPQVGTSSGLSEPVGRLLGFQQHGSALAARPSAGARHRGGVTSGVWQPSAQSALSRDVSAAAIETGRCQRDVPASHLSSVDFFDARQGLAVWPGSSRCPARLFSTGDGGGLGRQQGAALPTAPDGGSYYNAAIAFDSPWRGMALGGPGNLEGQDSAITARAGRCPITAAGLEVET